MFCRECGNTLGEGAEFCGKCGTRVVRSTDSAPAPAGAAATVPFAAPVAPAAAAPVAPATAKRRRPLVWVAVTLVVVLTLVGGGAAAWALGAFDSLSGAESAEDSSRDRDSRADDDDDSPRRASSDSGDDDASTAEEVQPEPDTLSSEQSFAALQAHYEKLWTLHAAIGLQDADAYTGTGFVFEAGGFNQTIGHPDRAVREELVARCKAKLDEITAAADECSGLAVDPAYAADQERLEALYDHLFNRTDALYQSALVAVDNPDRDSGWGAALQPRSKDNRVAFEEAYPDSEPVRR